MSAAREMILEGGRFGASCGEGGGNGVEESTRRGSRGSSNPTTQETWGTEDTFVPLVTPGIESTRDSFVPPVTPGTAREGERDDASSAAINDGREMIYIDNAQRGKKFGPNSEDVARFISKVLKRFIPLGALQWKDMPNDVRDTMFNKFMAKYRFSCPADEAIARHVWEHIAKMRMSNLLAKARARAKRAAGGMDDTMLWKEHSPPWMRIEVWSSLCEKWNTEEWRKRSQAGKDNRAKVSEANVHTSGSVSYATQKRRMEADLGREVKYREVFDRTHKKKGTDLYVSVRSQKVAEAYAGQMMEKYGEDVDQQPALDCEAWIAAAGLPKKGRVYGFGESLDSSQVLLSSYGSCSASSNSFFGTTTADNSETQLDRMVEQLENRLSQKLRSEISETVQTQLMQTVQTQLTETMHTVESSISSTVVRVMASYFGQLRVPPHHPSSSAPAPCQDPTAPHDDRVDEED
ncbi:hypothetical protein Taro_034144 [Colocasia esculenta]|uniref:Transposase n=1 Tax=Colocasia esculenta TaxID=4460 RepID=A0A843VZX4_COLES|nr:hypothetical protein [Colocasia esculenta]